MKIALTIAAGLMAVSSYAFAADNNNGNNGGNNGMKNDQTTTGAIDSENSTEPPTQKMIDDCKTAPADDQNCKNILDAR